MDSLTIALAYYENPHMLREQQRVISTWPEHVRKRTRLIVVDDASPKFPAHEAVEDWTETYHDDWKLEIYRINEPTPWGQLRARNLGMHVAPPGAWVLATDIDHVLPAECAERLLDLKPLPGRYYTFGRRMPDGSETKPHPNTYLMNRDWFWDEVGGCNEDFVGYYGTDSIFRRRAALFGIDVHLTTLYLTVYNRDGIDIGGIEGAGTREWGRKKSRWHARNNHVVNLRMKTAHLKRPEKTLRFTWERVRWEQQAWIVPDECADKFLFAKVSLSQFDRRVQLEVVRDNEIHEMTLQEAEQLAKALMSAVEAVKG